MTGSVPGEPRSIANRSVERDEDRTVGRRQLAMPDRPRSDLGPNVVGTRGGGKSRVDGFGGQVPPRRVGGLLGRNRGPEANAARFAILALVLSSVALVAFIVLEYFSTIFLIAAVPVGCAAYLLSRGRRTVRAGGPSVSEVRRVGRLRRVASIVFFLSSGMSLLVLASQEYSRSWLYNGLVAAGAAALVFQIGSVRAGRGVPPILGQVLFLAANLFGSAQLVFPFGIGGSDTPTHVDLLVRPIFQTGHIPGVVPCGFGFDYEAFPAHHLLAVAGALLLGIDPVRSYYLMAFLGAVLVVGVAFLIVRCLANPRIGLFAALLLAGSSYFIYWASHAAPLSYAVVPIAFLLYGIAKMRTGRIRGHALLAVPFSASLVFTHPYSSVIFSLIAAGLLIAQFAFRGSKRRPWGTVITILVFLSILLVHWVYYSCQFVQAEKLAGEYISILTREPELSPPAVYDVLPLQLIFLNTMGDAILIVVALVGLLKALARPDPSRKAILLGPALTLVVIAAIGVVSNLVYLLPNRIYVLLQLLGLAPLAGFALGFPGPAPSRPRGLPRVASKRLTTLVIVALLTGAFVFLSSASIVAGFETSPFTANRPYVKLYETPYERQGASWVCQQAAGIPTVRLSPSVSGFTTHEINRCLAARGGSTADLPVSRNGTIEFEKVPSGSLVVFSHYDLDPGFQSGITGRGKSGQGVFQRLSVAALSQLDGVSKVYDNGPVEVLWIP